MTQKAPDKSADCGGDTADTAREDPDQAGEPESVTYINVNDLRDDDDDDTCLRPLGLCDLGGCCDICWYNPEHDRFKKQGAT